MKKPKIVWFARGGGIARCGPFKSQIEAVNAMRLDREFLKRGSSRMISLERIDRSLFPSDVFVWPEEK